MIFLPKFDPEAIIELMPATVMGIPTFYTRLLQSPALTKASPSTCGCLFRARHRCRRHPSRMGRAYRPRRPRALRHVRNRHEHLEPL